MKKRTLCLILCLLMLLSSTVLAANEQAKTIRLEKTEGDAITITDAAGKSVALMTDMRLYHGYQIQTGGNSYVWLSLDDAKSVKLDENTQLELRKRGKKIQLNLLSGSILLNVSSHLGDDEELTVRTATIVTGIRGTVPLISYHPYPLTWGNTPGKLDLEAWKNAYKKPSMAWFDEVQSFTQSSEWLDQLAASQKDYSSANEGEGEIGLTTIALLEGTLVVQPVGGEEFTLTAGNYTEVSNTQGTPTVETRELSTEDIGVFTVTELEEDPELRQRIDDAIGSTDTEESFTEQIIQSGGTLLNPSETEANTESEPTTATENTDYVFKEETESSGGTGTVIHTHEWSEPVYNWDAAHVCTATRNCAIDSVVETESVTAVETVTAPDCEHTGLRKWTATFSNTAFVTQTQEETIPALEHDYATITYRWNTDYTACTATATCSRDGSHVVTENGTVTTQTVAATLEQGGTVTAIVSFTNSLFTQQSHLVSTTPQEHEYTTITYSWNTDSTACTATADCSQGDSTVTEEAVISKETLSPTCLDSGSETITATFENALFTTQTRTFSLDPLGHVYTVSQDTDWIAYPATGETQYYYLQCGHDDCDATETEISYLRRMLQNAEITELSSYSGLLDSGTDGFELFVPSGKTLTVAGLQLPETTTITVFGTLNLNEGSNYGVIYLEQGGTLNLYGTLESTGSLFITENSTLNLKAGASLAVDTENDLYIRGTVNMEDGSSLTAYNAIRNPENGLILIAEGADVTITCNTLYNYSGNSLAVPKNSKLTVNGITSNEGQLSLVEGSTYTANGVFENFGTVTIGKNATLDVTVSQDTSLNHENGNISMADGSKLTVKGKLDNNPKSDGIEVVENAAATITSAGLTNSSSLMLSSGSTLNVVNTDESTPKTYNSGTITLYPNSTLNFTGVKTEQMLSSTGTIDAHYGSTLNCYYLSNNINATEQKTGTLKLAGTLNVTNLVNNGSTNVSGGQANVTKLQNDGTLTLSDNGKLNLTGSERSYSAGSITVKSGCTLKISGQLESGGNIYVNQGGTLLLDENAVLSITGTGLFTNNGTLTLGKNAKLTTAGSVANTGTLNLSEGATLTATGADQFTNSGTLTLGKSAVLTTACSVANTGTLALSENAKLTATVANATASDMVFYNSGTVTLSNGSQITSNGVLWNETGSSKIEVVENATANLEYLVLGNSGSMIVHSNAELYAVTSDTDPKIAHFVNHVGASIDLEENAVLWVKNGELDSLGTIQTASGSLLYAPSIWNDSRTIEETSEVQSGKMNLSGSLNAEKLVNYGGIYVTGADTAVTVLDLANYSWLAVGTDSSFTVKDSMGNYSENGNILVSGKMTLGVPQTEELGDVSPTFLNFAKITVRNGGTLTVNGAMGHNTHPDYSGNGSAELLIETGGIVEVNTGGSISGGTETNYVCGSIENNGTLHFFGGEMYLGDTPFTNKGTVIYENTATVFSSDPAADSKVVFNWTAVEDIPLNPDLIQVSLSYEKFANIEVNINSDVTFNNSIHVMNNTTLHISNGAVVTILQSDNESLASPPPQDERSALNNDGVIIVDSLSQLKVIGILNNYGTIQISSPAAQETETPPTSQFTVTGTLNNYGTIETVDTTVQVTGPQRKESNDIPVVMNYGIMTLSGGTFTTDCGICSTGQLTVDAGCTLTAYYLECRANKETQDSQTYPAPKLVVKGNSSSTSDIQVSYILFSIEDASIKEKGVLHIGKNDVETNQPSSTLYGTMNVSGSLVVNAGLDILPYDESTTGTLNVLTNGTVWTKAVVYSTDESYTVNPGATVNQVSDSWYTGTIRCSGKFVVSGSLYYKETVSRQQPTQT